MKLAITGAGGFLGREIVARALLDPDITEIRASDLDLSALPADPRIEQIPGDLREAALRDRLLAGADAVIHLAAILGGAAENDPVQARAFNVDLTLTMADQVRARPQTRFVFASSIAALGSDLPDPVSDATPCRPVMVYGAHKAMVELALSHYARRGWLDAVSLRPSGIVARKGVDASLKSAFLSRVFWAVAEGQDITLPVAESSRSWFASVRNVATNFLHGALADPGPSRTMTLPALSLTMRELVDALRRYFPDSPAQVRFRPTSEAVALFGRFPMLETEAADAAGFLRDGGVDALVAAAFPEGRTP